MREGTPPAARTYGARAQAAAVGYGAVTGLALVAVVVAVEGAFARRRGRSRG